MTDFLNREEAVLLVVDVQEKLVPAIHKDLYARSLKNMQIVIEAAGTLGLPILLTEQYPKGLGVTISPIKEALGGKEPFVKMTFSCWGLTQLPKALEEKGIEKVIVVGIESHVCVLQTALDLFARGFQVHLLRDAVSSRHEEDERTALQRMAREGVVITTVEMALFELLRTAEAPEFKQISRLIK